MRKPHRLDEYPVHQGPLSMGRTMTTDRNFYDRNYFNAQNRDGGTFLVTGFGVYPNLGVVDAFATVRKNDRQLAVRFSDALDERSTDSVVGGYRIEVIEPLSKVRVICEHDDMSFDITWDGSFDAVLEELHINMGGPRPILEATRFAQVGTWAGTLSVFGEDMTVDPSIWLGSRDRSWGIRPSGDADPAGRTADEPREGHWWTYVPLRFDDFMVIIIAQEDPDGYRTLNTASRVFPDGRVEQLGWPRFEIDYKSGTRMPVHCRVHLTTPKGEPLVIDVEPKTHINLNRGCGYVGDPDWGHGMWKGRNWSSSEEYDLQSQDYLTMLPYGTLDHVARATCNGQEGWGLFEHAALGRYDPSGFVGWVDMAP
ncbi:hypothetical protein GDN83_02215 [Gordonia jinghuaiqii]|uniref:Uncharacterized protein n=1 Tax=Gordonia jinghuaiqii TaxID=2758710 RepID=A0A7D7QXN1_9ACTN|nr:hypothetical protein [Gordonia jinghuaiqii]MCR5976581.1 hypothetical protein [Gordonia jinghuaiqii]QMS99770.1 hypothetical protein H1R19_12275 [Gordonia jinghuaiqii]